MEALTIKTFKTSKISAVEVSERQSKDFKYKSIKFTSNGAEVPPLRVRMETSEFLISKTRMDLLTLRS